MNLRTVIVVLIIIVVGLAVFQRMKNDSAGSSAQVLHLQGGNISAHNWIKGIAKHVGSNVTFYCDPLQQNMVTKSPEVIARDWSGWHKANGQVASDNDVNAAAGLYLEACARAGHP